MTTAIQVQYRRGTQAQIAAFTGAAGEMNVDSTNNRVIVQDGATVGGWPAAKLSEIGGGHLNKFRNGTMDLWQRGTSALAATTSGAYTADGWIVLPTGASVTAAQAGGRLTTKNSLQVTGASSVTDLIIKQRIESLIAAAFCSQTVTVQAQVYNNTGITITPKLTVNRPSAQDNYSSVTADVNAVSLQACANAVWSLVSYTFQANSLSYNGLEIAFDFGNNFGANTKSLQITECDIRVTNGVPAGLCANPPPPELRMIATEIGFNQRYYQNSFNGAAPAQGIGANMGELQWAAANTAGNITRGYIHFPVPMRASPAVTVYNPVSSNSQAYDLVTATDCSGTGTNNVNATGFRVAANLPTGAASADVIGANWTASAEL